MKTPTLILSDVRDARVTVSQSYELYHALRDNGVPVKFVAYPVDGHFPGDPVRTTDVYRRWLEWLDQYLKGGGSSRGGVGAVRGRAGESLPARPLQSSASPSPWFGAAISR